MNYCVVVRISRQSVSFWYQADGKRYSPLIIKGTNEVPLYFCVEDNQFSFGSAARDRFYNNDPNAYGNYFEIIKDPAKHFIIYNTSRRVKQLLYYGIEQYLTHFLNSVLYKSDSIESYRPTFPLQFIFEPDLDEPERNLVRSLFTEAGYRNVSVISYNDVLLELLRKTGFIRADHASLILTGLDDTLYLGLYLKQAETPVSATALPKQGADPRIRILAEMIMDYITDQNSYLDLDRALEVRFLLPYCAGLLSGAGMIINGEAELSQGKKFWYSVKLKNVEERLQYHQGDLLVSASINDMLHNFKLRSEDVILLLVSDQIRTPYFSDRLLKQFPHVKSIEPVHVDGTMQLIFSKGVLSKNGDVQESRREKTAPPPIPPKSQVVSPPPVKPLLPDRLSPANLPPPGSSPVVAPAGRPPLPELKSRTNKPGKAIVPPPLPSSKKKI